MARYCRHVWSLTRLFSKTFLWNLHFQFSQHYLNIQLIWTANWCGIYFSRMMWHLTWYTFFFGLENSKNIRIRSSVFKTCIDLSTYYHTPSENRSCGFLPIFPYVPKITWFKIYVQLWPRFGKEVDLIYCMTICMCVMGVYCFGLGTNN